MVDSSFENVVIDHYYAFRIFEPYKLNSEIRKLDIIQKIIKCKLFISQTDKNRTIGYTSDFEENILKGYEKSLNNLICQFKLEII